MKTGGIIFIAMLLLLVPSLAFAQELPDYSVAAQIQEYEYSSSYEMDKDLALAQEEDSMRTREARTMPLRVLSFALVVAAVFLSGIAGKRNKVARSAVFEAPENMTPADVGYVLDGETKDKDIAALLLYWADRGHLEIHQQEQKNVLFQKIKDLPETANDYEKALFGKLFVLGDSISIKGMGEEFADTVRSAKRFIKTKFNYEKNRVFTKKSVAFEYLTGALAAVPLALTMSLGIYYATMDGFLSLFPGPMVWVIGFIAAMLVCDARDNWNASKESHRYVKLAAGLLMIAGLFVLVTFMCYDIFGWFPLVPAVSMVIMALLAPGMRRRTKQGAEWTGHILGLKNYIQTADAGKLEELVKEDPAYFYHMLPYAYVLGTADTWAKQFERIDMEPLCWYYGYGNDTFSTVWFVGMLNKNLLLTR